MKTIWDVYNYKHFSLNNSSIIFSNLTFVALFIYLALSFSISRHDLMTLDSWSSITMPGPCVHGPPMKVMILAGTLGYEHSSSPTAIDKATPTLLSDLFPWATGQGSLWSSLKRSEAASSHTSSGCTNLSAETVLKLGWNCIIPIL